jgi:hypothetical protein
MTNGIDNPGTHDIPNLLPKAKMISENNITAAYIFDSQYQLRRIEAFAQMNSEALADLGAIVPHTRRRRSQHHHRTSNKHLN